MMMPQFKYTWFWRPREGGKCSISIKTSSADYQAVRQEAIKLGYPGHAGGWWNWFVEDGHAFLTRILGVPT